MTPGGTPPSHRDVVDALSPAKRALLEQRLSARRAPAALVVPRRAPDAVVPLTPAQRVLWLFDRVAEGRAAYNMTDVWRLRGPVDADALRAALDAVIVRHEALRTVIGGPESDPVQLPRPTASVPWTFRDLRSHAARERDDAVHTLVSEAAHRPFDLAHEIPIRATLVRVAEHEWVLVLVMHHIAADGWSRGTILRDLAAAYRQTRAGEPAALPPVPLQFADFAVWHASRLDSPDIAPHVAFWREQLAPPRPTLALPTDRPRERAHSGAGAVRREVWPPALRDAVVDAARRARVTPFMLLLAAWQAVLARHAGQDEIIVGSPVAGRGEGELDEVVGYLANTLPIRTSLAGDPTFAELLDRVRDGVLAAFEHQAVPLEAMLPDTAASSEPLFRTLFAMQNYRRATLTLDGVDVAAEPPSEVPARADLTLGVVEREDGLRLALEFATELFDSATAERLLARFRHFVTNAIAFPGERIGSIPLVPAAERATVLREWNPPGSARWPDATVHALFEERVRSAPDAIAVEDACLYVPTAEPGATSPEHGERLSYRELNERANRLAWQLRRVGVAPEVRVAVCLDKSARAVAALLGVLKAGGAYVPIDPAYPDERIAYLLADSGALAIVTSRDIAERLRASGVVPDGVQWLLVDQSSDDSGAGDADVADPPPVAGPRSLCYVIYTSGSTGRPKGVLVEHEQVVQLVCNDELPFEFSASDVWTVFHSLAFDFSVWEIYGALLWGGRTIVVPRAVAQDPAAYATLLERAQVTVLNQTPSAFYALMQEALGDEAPRLASLRYVVFGGEALQPALLGRWYERYPATALVNMFGITETTVHVTVKRIRREEIELGTSNIGRALPPLSVYVLDDSLQPVPIGVVGELCVGGAGVARGYLGRPELTGARFVPDPFSARAGARLYRSGDLARWNAAGELEYLGRRDAQVKLRGHRIELGEIEGAVGRHPGVGACAATLRSDTAAGPRLVLYYVARATVGATDAPLTAAALASWVAERLPQYMVPSAFVPVAALPMTSNGKVDRAALPVPPLAEEEGGEEPRSEAERAVAAVWGQILGVPRVPRDRSFFELGGHSLLAVRAVGQVNRIFRASLSLRGFFTAPTVADVVRELVVAEPRPGQVDAIAQLFRKVQAMSPEERERARNGSAQQSNHPDTA